MKKILVFAILCVALVACKNKSVDNSAAQAETFKVFTEKVQQINMSLTSPDDIMDIIELSGVDFMPELVNDPNNNEKYLSNDVLAAANVGIYLVDGLYQYASKEFTNGYQSILAAKNIATKIGMGKSFDELIVERYNNPDPKIDTFLVKLKESIESSATELEAQDKIRLYTSMVGANYIEKEYILFNIVFNYNVDIPDETKLMILRQVIFATGEHLKKLPEVISLIESVKKDTDPGTILDELKALEVLRQQIVTPADPSQVTPAQIFENKNLLAMFEKIKALRNMLVAVPSE